jgi:AbrB family looped-hinge helix DNA binding protein
MQTTIDSAGRLVIPKPLRVAMGLTPGTPVDITFTDGRLEIDFAPMQVDLDLSGDLPVLHALGEVTPLTDDDVRAALEATRR